MMYLISIKASKKKMRENGLTPEQFWDIVDANMEDQFFECFGGDDTGHLYDGQEYLQAFDIAFFFSDDGLQRYLYSMTDYTIYCVYDKALEEGHTPKTGLKLRQKDKKILEDLKSTNEECNRILSRESVCFERCVSMLPMLIEWDQNDCAETMKMLEWIRDDLGVQKPRGFRYTPESYPEWFPEMGMDIETTQIPDTKTE